MHPKEKPFGNAEEQLNFERLMKKKKRDEAKQGHKNAESNLTSLLKDYPGTKQGINLKFVETELPDLLSKEKHMP